MALGQRLNTKEIAETIMAGVVAHYAAATDPDLAVLPPSRIIQPGDPASVAWDCEQLTVALQGIGFGQMDDAAGVSPQVGAGASVANMRHTIFEVSLVRCVPVAESPDELPTDLEITRAGVQFMCDAGMLSQALTEIASRVRQGLGGTGLVRAGTVLPVGPEGGFAAVVGLFQVSSLELV